MELTIQMVCIRPTKVRRVDGACEGRGDPYRVSVVGWTNRGSSSRFALLDPWLFQRTPSGCMDVDQTTN